MRFAVVPNGAEHMKSLHRCLLMPILSNILVLCKMCIKFSINLTSFFQKYMLKTTRKGDRGRFRLQLRPFSVSQVISTYALLG